MLGAYRRRIDLATRQLAESASEARVAIEDDHHHFRISMFSLNGVVSEIASQTLRAPTLMCPSAGPRLQNVVGMPLVASCAAALAHTDPRQQCTHLIEMAGLMAAALARGVDRRVYEAEVADPVGGVRIATLRRDGEIVLAWRLEGMTIVAPECYAGRSILKGFMELARALELEAAEAALVLRRAVYTSGGRGMDLDAMPESRRTAINGQCWARQPERADRAFRNVGSTWDFSDRPEALTAEDRDWIAFSPESVGAYVAKLP
jgi:Protein of unknown function (DUF2889)